MRDFRRDVMHTMRESEATLNVFDLHRLTPLKTFGGRGCEALCDYCGTAVEKTDIEFEVDGELDGMLITVHLHQHCHDLCLAD
jgi:hypothetical protein